MVGSDGDRMLGITLPHVTAWNAWYAWFDNRVDRYRELHARIDAACRAAGRDPSEVERTAALFVAFPDAFGRSMGDRTAPENESLPSEPTALAAALREFAAEGVGHVQLVLDPITASSIARLEPVLALLDA
jgi:alkanesulfonate monooxygenase SsuD/methylene tetrahydromethanopterin reductase-like flavin-dependent oxidoreductase (luciferase family)